MATKEDWNNCVMKMWVCVRKHNHDIPSDVLDEMRDKLMYDKEPVITDLVKKRYIYSYCAYVETKTQKFHIDGIANMEKRIVDMADYMELKCVIVEQHDWLMDHPITILSLVPLGEI
jgi:hypothetical protein